jgi:hypothetical protein
MPDPPAYEWRPVPGYPGYEVSQWGGVRSWRNQRGQRRTEPKALERHVNDGGYHIVYLCRDGDSPRGYRVHRLVAEAFIGPRPDGYDVCHNNGVRNDNYFLNLRYDTRAGNFADMLAHGTRPRGEQRPNARLSYEKAAEIRADWPAVSQQRLAERHGVTRGTIRDVLRGRTWNERAAA